MSPATRIEARILASVSFRRARTRADGMLNSPTDLRVLLAGVEAKQVAYPKLQDGAVALDIDIICSVIEAHCDAISHPSQNTNTTTSITGKARLTLVVAALTYLVEDDDLIPDHLPHGLTDDIALLRWASRMARAELPA